MTSTRYDLTGFTVEQATEQDWVTVNEWGNGEGWNIGFQDSACFLPTDPGGFFVGKVDGRPVSAVSLVNYSDDYAVWGHYLVHPELRGRGYGRAVCKVASSRSGARVTSGDAMPEQVRNYSKDGSAPAHDTLLWVGAVTGTAGPAASGPAPEPVTADLVDAVVDYDGATFPARRPEFMTRWLTAAGHVALVTRDGDSQVTGFGVIRPAPLGWRIGPLAADTTGSAAALFDALVEHAPAGTEVSAFAPDVQPAAAQLYAGRGLTSQFRVVRMYRGSPPQHRGEAVFAIGSLELG